MHIYRALTVCSSPCHGHRLHCLEEHSADPGGALGREPGSGDPANGAAASLGQEPRLTFTTWLRTRPSPGRRPTERKPPGTGRARRPRSAGGHAQPPHPPTPALPSHSPAFSPCSHGSGGSCPVLSSRVHKLSHQPSFPFRPPAARHPLQVLLTEPTRP